MSKITPCLWFNFKAEEAVAHYMRIFKDSKVIAVSRYDDAMPQLKGQVLAMRFELEGREYQALNAGPQFPFTEAISLSVSCSDQGEVDLFWHKLSEGGSTGQCGWLKDKFGLSWQVVPSILQNLLADPDPSRSQRVMAALMQMTKLDIASLRAAHAGQ